MRMASCRGSRTIAALLSLRAHYSDIPAERCKFADLCSARPEIAIHELSEPIPYCKLIGDSAPALTRSQRVLRSIRKQLLQEKMAMRSPKLALAPARPAGDSLPELALGDEIVRRLEASCPGDTFMPPVVIGDPQAVVARWFAEAQLTGEIDAYLGKRAHPRCTWNAVVLIRVCGGELAGKIIRAHARNVSLGGMGILIRSQLEADVQVEVSVEGRPHSIKAIVVHCTRAVTGNLLGLRFDFGSC
jgi:hypothetical protein